MNNNFAENMAVVCSLLATCHNHDVNPRIYLNGRATATPMETQASESCNDEAEG